MQASTTTGYTAFRLSRDKYGRTWHLAEGAADKTATRRSAWRCESTYMFAPFCQAVLTQRTHTYHLTINRTVPQSTRTWYNGWVRFTQRPQRVTPTFSSHIATFTNSMVERPIPMLLTCCFCRLGCHGRVLPCLRLAARSVDVHEYAAVQQRLCKVKCYPGLQTSGMGLLCPLATGLVPSSDCSANADLVSGYSRRPVIPVCHTGS